MANEIIYPNLNPYLIGHDEEVRLFLSAFNSGALHHGWLITGDEGIGKATLAYKIARFLLSAEEGKEYNALDVAVDSPIFAQVAQKSHPDFKVLERDFTETDKKKLIKAIKQGEDTGEEMRQGLKRSAVIKVEDVRDVVTFLSKKSFNDNWRVVIVDSADDLNISSANALLKILEEPPLKSILLLISHNPGKLLPTIRSRCARLALKPLKETEVASLLRRYQPDLKEAEVQGLAKISAGSIGRALKYAANDALLMYENIKKVCYGGAKCDGQLLLDLANDAAAEEDCWDLFAELICRFARDNLADAAHPRELYEAYEATLKILDETVRLNMDKKQAVLQILTKFSGAL
ncbi:MAG: DNA polymerase III subunit delta' [Acetobacter sp.]|nr:DNA polymerase III subunit delta' [Acetobacter sp.]